MDDTPKKNAGLREHKKRQTRRLIAEVGLNLFLAKGYEATTVDEIVATAGISRRTFFHYFKSKDEILLAQLDSYVEALKLAVLDEASTGARPVETARAALLAFSSLFETPHAIAIARLMRGNETLRVRGAGGHHRLENALHEGLSARFPELERRDRLRIVAMASIAVLRFAIDRWFEQNCERSLGEQVRHAFDHLKAEI